MESAVLETLKGLGPTGAVLLFQFWVIRYFMAEMEKKDAALRELTKGAVAAMERMTAAIDRLERGLSS